MSGEADDPDKKLAPDGEALPDIGQFVTTLDQIDQSLYGGRCAEIFFGWPGTGIMKWPHYLPIYDRLFARFAGRPVKFLEIGVLAGGSMQMWREYFGPAATIFGIDINLDCAGYGEGAGQVRIGSQDDPDFLRAVVEEMGGVDVVLDDGSHIASHQRASFDVLFPLLSDDGLYVIEDLHTAYWPDYEGGLKRPGTMIEYLKDMIDQLHTHYFTQGANQSERMAPIASLQFFDSIAAIEKLRQTPRWLTIAPQPK